MGVELGLGKDGGGHVVSPTFILLPPDHFSAFGEVSEFQFGLSSDLKLETIEGERNWLNPS